MSVSDEQVVRVLGVRHHGPGSARAVLAALEELRPEVVLIEGPADADPVVGLAGQGMVPPVALLGYAVGDPSLAAFWPMAVFSPEWQAITWAGEHGVPVRFIDLPAAVVLAQTVEDRTRAAELPGEGDSGHREDPVRSDPIAMLAAAAGYDDPERWWDDVVESRGHHAFDVIIEAMAEVRAALDPPDAYRQLLEARREAHMRQVLRATLKTGASRIAVVCGAWHAPVLTLPLPPASRDAALLRRLPKVKAALTWVPWTHSRLALASGYGAGIVSPGWYAHLFASTDHPVEDWLTTVAAALRARDLPVSSAHVIEAVRLAETLAVLRNRPLAGLSEVMDATLAVICGGNETTLAYVTADLVVGECLGQVPENTPSVPLEADLTALTRRLRLPRAAAASSKDLDLRNTTDIERSRLLHRLRLLGVGWGTPAASLVRNIGTFRETWQLQWRPELAIDVIEAAVWGTTVEAAATAKVCSDAFDAALPQLTALVEAALLAGLAEALPDLTGALDARAARDHDVTMLMASLPPLVRSLRYGDVRGTDTSSLAHVADSLLTRICAGLPSAVTSLDDDGAAELRLALDGVHAAVALRDDPAGRTRWLDALAGLITRADVHGLLVGRLVRLLLDAGRLDAADAGTRLHRALSVGSAPADKAAWVEGFLAGSGLLLVHDPTLLGLLDEWVSGLTGTDFLEAAPLLRRTFGQFEAGERRAIAEAVARTSSGPRGSAGAADRPVAEGAAPDQQRAAGAVATVARLLGLRR